MKCTGFKISGYDATYKRTLFAVNDKAVDSESCVLEITDLESGTTFIVDLESGDNQGTKSKIRKWVKREQGTDHHGVSIVFGSKGIFEQLKFDGKKINNKR